MTFYRLSLKILIIRKQLTKLLNLSSHAASDNTDKNHIRSVLKTYNIQISHVLKQWKFVSTIRNWCNKKYLKPSNIDQ